MNVFEFVKSKEITYQVKEYDIDMIHHKGGCPHCGGGNYTDSVEVYKDKP